MNCIFQVTNLEFVNLFLVGKVFGFRVFKVVGEDVSKGLIVFLIEKNFVFVGAAVKDMIKVLWFKVSIVVFTGH